MSETKITKDDLEPEVLGDYLAKDNIDIFTPTGDYNPATKKYVDDNSLVSSVNTKTGIVVLTTTDISEGTNEYYTEAKVSANTDVALNTSHRGSTINPHAVTQAQVGLSNVDNTSDIGKPTSTDTQTALDLKANTFSNRALLDSITNSGSGIIISSIERTNFGTAYSHSQLITGNPHSVTKSDIGLSYVIDSGTGDNYLSDDGTYKTVTGGVPSSYFIAQSTMTTNISGTNADITWNTEYRKDSDFTHTVGSTDILCNFDGEIIIEHFVSIEGASNRVELNNSIYLNSALEVASISGNYVSRDATGQTKGGIGSFYYLSISVGDAIKLNSGTTVDGGAANINPNGTRIKIERIS